MYLSEYMDALEDNDIGHETPKYEDLYQQCGLGN